MLRISSRRRAIVRSDRIIFQAISKTDRSEARNVAIMRCSSSRSSKRRPITSSRSEEHTSELQSPCNLVCRLLLEKKKKKKKKQTINKKKKKKKKITKKKNKN